MSHLLICPQVYEVTVYEDDDDDDTEITSAVSRNTRAQPSHVHSHSQV